MDFEEKVQAIKSTTLFQKLPLRSVRQLAYIAREREVSKKELFINQGDDPDAAFIICSGGVRVYTLSEDGEEVTLAILGTGEIVGEISLIDEGPRSACVEALEQTLLLEVGKVNFRLMIKQNPEIAVNLLYAFAHRIRVSNQQMELIHLKNLIDRTWTVLQTLAEFFPNREITLSQEQIAGIVGASRARVTEVLSKLEVAGKINISHRRIYLLN